jgi:putative transposase
MRKARLKAPPSYPVAYYHCVSRVVDRQFVLGPAEKEQWVSLMREYERFCGVRIVTYCIMSNHFHILVEVPERPKEPLSDQTLLERVDGLSGMSSAGTIRQQLGWFRERGQAEAAEALRERILARMWDVSWFMKLLKQRFTQWHNRRQGRKGTLWEERFKSVLVEGAGDVVAAMAAYIDLNPVRAKLVEDPKDYRWSGYGEAMGGGREARAGLRLVVEAACGQKVAEEQVLGGYRMWLYGVGEAGRGLTEEGQAVRAGFTSEQVKQVVAEKGRLPLGEYLRLRVRYFTDGAVLGSRNYVNGIYLAFRERFGPRRKNGARRMRYVDHGGMYCLRDLQVRILGHD